MRLLQIAYSGDVNGGFQRDVNKRSGDVNKVRSAATLVSESCLKLSMVIKVDKSALFRLGLGWSAGHLRWYSSSVVGLG